VNPFDAVNKPAEVIVPAPVVEILFDIEIDPNPEAIEPDASAPTVVREEVTTLEARVVPEISAAAFTVMLAFGNVIVRRPPFEAPVILNWFVPGVPEVPAIQIDPQGFAVEPRSSAPAVPGMRAVLIATEARLSRAVVARPEMSPEVAGV